MRHKPKRRGQSILHKRRSKEGNLLKNLQDTKGVRCGPSLGAVKHASSEGSWITGMGA